MACGVLVEAPGPAAIEVLALGAEHEASIAIRAAIVDARQTGRRLPRLASNSRRSREPSRCASTSQACRPLARPSRSLPSSPRDRLPIGSGRRPSVHVPAGHLVAPQLGGENVGPVQRSPATAPEDALAQLTPAVDHEPGDRLVGHARAYHSATLPSACRHNGLRQCGGFWLAASRRSSSISTPSPGFVNAAMLPVSSQRKSSLFST